jgi:hypothetical protein
MNWRKQFSLRDLVWLVFLCGMAIGWFADHNQQQREINAAEGAAIAERRTRIERDMGISIIHSRFHVPKISVKDEMKIKARLRAGLQSAKK